MPKHQAATKLSPKEFEGIEKMVRDGFYLNVSDFVRSAVREKLSKINIVIVRNVSPRVAQREVLEYIKSHPDIYPDEIADALTLDFETVMNAVSALISKGEVGESA